METSTMRHLRLAAESGEAASQFNLGILYDSRLDDNGYAIEGNRVEAIKWLLAAAEQGLPRAQSKLASLCRRSECFGKLRERMRLVSAGGNKLPRHTPQTQARSGYERIASHLTPAQLVKAKRLARLWRRAKSVKIPSFDHRRMLSKEEMP